MGTVDYMAPEQALSSHHADARADIYSLGCSLYYLVAGKPIYRGASMMAKLLAHRESPIPALRDAQPETPAPVEAVFRKMVAKKIADRYQTMNEVMVDLDRCGVGSDMSFGIQPSPEPDADEGVLTFLRDVPPASTQKPNAAKKPAPAKMGKGRQRLSLRSVGAAVICAAVLTAAIGLLKNRDGALVAEVKQAGAIDRAKQKTSAGGDRPGAGVGQLATKARPTAFNDPAFRLWAKQVAALSAEKQVEAVAKKLQELNPGFDGRITGLGGKDAPKINKGVVTEVRFVTDNVTDLSPVRALTGLKVLHCIGSGKDKGKLSDLSPLEGMSLRELDCRMTQVSDLAPLKGLPLQALTCHVTQVSDLSPLKGMPLRKLDCHTTPIFDLSPLRGMPLETLTCYVSKVADLSPLKGMPLADLDFGNTLISDLSPLEGMPLRQLRCGSTPISDLSPLRAAPLEILWCYATNVSDVSPLEGMSLTNLSITPKSITKGMGAIRQMKTLKIIRLGVGNNLPPPEFWRRYDAGEFGEPAATLSDPASQQRMS
jgi:hypothetical protein